MTQPLNSMESYATEEEFTCSICLDVAEAAMEMDCCHQIYCSACISDVKLCPACRQPASCKIAHFARRVIGNLATTCRHGCGATFPRSEVAGHDRNCAHRMIKCKSPGCGFDGVIKDVAIHIATEHTETLVERMDVLFKVPAAVADIKLNKDGGMFGPVKNDRGFTAKLGLTGKYYCGAALDDRDPPCGCCDRQCGPADGCNCESCMRLDLVRRVVPKSGLVNREGRVAMYSMTQGKFYCGTFRPELTRARECDGYCGPRDGPNCFSCNVLKTQAATRYRAIMRP